MRTAILGFEISQNIFNKEKGLTMKIWKCLFVALCALCINSIIYGVISSYSGREFRLWILSPYLLFSIVIILVEKVFRRAKSNSISSRVLLACTVFFSTIIVLIGWSLTSVEIKSGMFKFLFLLQTILAVVNLLLLVKVKRDLGELEEIKFRPIKEEYIETQEFLENNMFVKSRRKDVLHSLVLHLIVFILIILLYAIIPIILRHIEDRSIILYFSTFLCFVLVIINHLKNHIYYGDGKRSKNRSIIEALLIIIGLSIHYYFEGVVYYKSTTINFFAKLLPLLFFITVFNTNYKMAMEHYKFLKTTDRNEKT